MRRQKRHSIVSASGLSLALLLAHSAALLANPTGGEVVAGSATIAGSGNTVTINQATPAAVINWQQFSIAGGEATHFNVPSNVSATLNRVTGGNPSAIYGTLTSNGKLFLINPNGIIVGPTGRIDTNGFLGSTLDISNDEFMKGGDMHFFGSSNASIDNQGVIRATGGDVYLIAKQVDNNGTISAPQGNVGLAAGLDVYFQQSGDQHLLIKSTPIAATSAKGVTNAGKIRAASVELKAAGGNAYALAINNTGVVAATGFKKINGQVYLTSDGGNISNSGKIIAKTADGNGGKIVLNGHGNSSSGTVLNSGKLIASGKATGKTGGTVQVLGNRVGITDNGVVDVSGDAGGGTALIGGDRHGDNPAIVNAEQTYLGPDAQIIADALRAGDGGKIILWGNNTTQAYGALSAKGGSVAGNGGFVETSAPNLQVRATVNTLAPHGVNGTWLLDPTDVLITDNASTSGNVSNTPAFTITGTAGGATISQSDLLLALQGGNVTIDATQGTGGNGTIIWIQPNSTALDNFGISGSTLTLNAPVAIILNNINITHTSTGQLNLVLNSSLTGAGSIDIYNSAIALGGGDFTANGNGYTSLIDNNYDANGVDIIASTINALGGNIMLKGTGGYSFNSLSTPNLQSGNGVSIFGGSVVETTGSGNITFDGTYSQAGSLNLQFVSGVALGGGNNLVSVGAGTISITGVVSQTYGNDSFSSAAAGVEIAQSSTVRATALGGSIMISGDTSGATTYDSGDGAGTSAGVDIGGDDFSPGYAVLTTIGGGSGISIMGMGGTLHTNSSALVPFQTGSTSGVSLEEGAQVTTLGTDNIAIQGTAGSIVVDSGNIESTAAGVSLFSSGSKTFGNILVSTASGNITIAGTGGNAPNLGVGVVIGGVHAPGGLSMAQATVQSVNGQISITGQGGAGNSGPGAFPGFYEPNSGIVIFNHSTLSTTGQLDLIGQGTGVGADSIAIAEITDPNFDTNPFVPSLMSSTFAMFASSGTPIEVFAHINVGSFTIVAPSADVDLNGQISASTLTIPSADFVSINSTGNIANLLTVNAGGFFTLFASGDLTVQNTVSAVGVTDIHTTGDLFLGANGRIIEQGPAQNFGVTPNIGSILEAGEYFVNNSTFGANAIQVDSSAYYFIFSRDPSFTKLGGLMPNFTISGVTFSSAINAFTPYQPGNTLFYAFGAPPTSPDQPLDNKNQILATITPQNNQIAPQAPPDQGTFEGGSLVPVSYTGNGIFGQTGGTGSDLANSSGNSGSVGAGDAAQLSGGELNNVTNPAASGSLNQALSPFVRGALSAALTAIGDEVSTATDDGTGGTDEEKRGKQHADNNHQTTVNQDDTVVIGGNGVQTLPPGQTPPQLQNALNGNTQADLNKATGH